MRDQWSGWGTPRTDAFYMRECGCFPKDRKPHEWVLFARQLEREIQRLSFPRIKRSKKVFNFDKAMDRIKEGGKCQG